MICIACGAHDAEPGVEAIAKSLTAGNPLTHQTKMSADLMLAGDAGDQFPKLFYSTLDNNRQVRVTIAALTFVSSCRQDM